MVASGALGFDGRGWLWERPLVKLGLIKPELFTIVTRTLTWRPRFYPVSNLSWGRPWTWLPWSSRSCVRFLPNGGAVNKVGLYNPSFYWWKRVMLERYGKKVPLVVSLYGEKHELAGMAAHIEDDVEVLGIELNVSCINSSDRMIESELIIQAVKMVKRVTHYPLFVKVSMDQDYLRIAQGLEGIVEGMSFNSVPWKIAFPGDKSPVAHIGKPGDGGVSGKPAQKDNWPAAQAVAAQTKVPVIFPSIMEYEDMAKARRLGASALSFGTIFMRTPWAPTAFVQRDRDERSWE
jgi:dihydroorotate dehydrogenase